MVARVQVDGLVTCNVVKVDAGTGREGITGTRLFAATIDNLCAGRIPGKSLDASEGAHRTLVRFALHDVFDALRLDVAGLIQRSQIGVRIVIDKVVPMAVVHLIYQASCGLVQTFEQSTVDTLDREGHDKEDLLAVGAELETLDVTVGIAYLATFRTVGFHLPNLRFSAFGREESNMVIVQPYGILLAEFSFGNVLSFSRPRVDVEQEQVAVALVLLDACIGDAIEQAGSVGRRLDV